MDLIITLLVYVLVFSLVYYLALAIMKVLEAPAEAQKFVRLALLIIALLFVLALFFDVEYLPRWRWHLEK